jgi:hypothetical protein
MVTCNPLRWVLTSWLMFVLTVLPYLSERRIESALTPLELIPCTFAPGVCAPPFLPSLIVYTTQSNPLPTYAGALCTAAGYKYTCVFLLSELCANSTRTYYCALNHTIPGHGELAAFTAPGLGDRTLFMNYPSKGWLPYLYVFGVLGSLSTLVCIYLHYRRCWYPSETTIVLCCCRFDKQPPSDRPPPLADADTLTTEMEAMRPAIEVRTAL